MSFRRLFNLKTILLLLATSVILVFFLRIVNTFVWLYGPPSLVREAGTFGDKFQKALEKFSATQFLSIEFVTLAVAISALFITYQQFHVHRESVRLNLFRETYRIFRIYWLVTSKLYNRYSLTAEDINTLREAIQEADFLIGEEGRKIGTEIYEIWNFISSRDETRDSHQNEMRDTDKLLKNLLDNRLQEVFSPYLSSLHRKK